MLGGVQDIKKSEIGGRILTEFRNISKIGKLGGVQDVKEIWIFQNSVKILK